MKTVISVILVTLISVQWVYASCVSPNPKNMAELQLEVQKVKMELNRAEQLESIYHELAADTAQTAKYSKTLFFASAGFVAPSVAGKAVTVIFAGELQSLGYVAVWASFEAKAVATALQKKSYYNDLLKDYRDQLAMAIVSKTCGYADKINFYQYLSNEIFENEFNGSLWNTMKDHVTLGSFSKKNMDKLYVLAHLRSAVLRDRLSDLYLLYRNNYRELK